MKIIEPSVELMRDFDGAEVLKFIERCGRTCYQSEKNITADSAEKFVRNLSSTDTRAFWSISARLSKLFATEA